MVRGKDVCAMELDFKAIGKRIKIARIKKNFTQEAVADRIGVSPQHVSNIETGNSSVSLPTLVAIANMLSVSVDELLCDTVLTSKPIFEREAKDIFEDCNEYEVRVLVDVLKATKNSMRHVKMFENKMNRNESNRSVLITNDCEVPLRFFFAEFITHTPNSQNILRIVWIGFYFLSKFSDKRSHVVCIRYIIISPYILIELFFCEYLSFMRIHKIQ